MIVCRRCGLDKSADDYHRSPSSPTGRKSSCRDCCAVADKEYRSRRATPAVSVVLAALDLMSDAELDVVRDALNEACPVVRKTPAKVDPFASSVAAIWQAG